MTDYSLFAAQVRAARAILGWSQAYLAAGVGVNKSTIVDLESNKRAIHEATRHMVLSELVAAGIDFTDNGGVEPREWPLKPYIPIGIASKMPRPTPSQTRGHTKKLPLSERLVSSADGRPSKKPKPTPDKLG
jgi:transcriptional regulator with XRE-family HTH domain